MSSTTTTTQSPQAGGKLPSEHDGFAIASLVTAFFLPILGIIFGHLSNHRAKLAHRAKSGLAVAGLVLGYLFTVISVLVIIIVAAASSSPSASMTPAPPASSIPAAPSSSATQAPVTQAPPAPATGHIGDTATVTDSSGDQYSVTIKQVIDPAQPADQFNTPDNGKHLVGVVYQVKVISGKIDDAAGNCATLIGSDGKAYTTTISSIAGYSDTTTLIKLNAGESVTGAVVFQVPDAVHASTVKWTPDSGFADSTATWNVAG
jgi:heme/copper-type cytochrome/quinol oxidase subunit 2